MHLGRLASYKTVAPGPKGRQTVAQCVSAGFRPPMHTQPRRSDRFPASSHTKQQLPARTDSSRPLRSRRKDAKTGRQWHPVFVPSPLCVFATLRLCVSQSGPPARFVIPPLAADQRAGPLPTRNLPKRDPAHRPLRVFASSHEPLWPNPRSMAAKITENRKRTLFPSDKADEPTRPRRTMRPPGKPSPHASVSGSVSASASKTHEEEPDWIPIHLGSFGSSQAVAPGPEGRQTIAQRVSAGFRPPMKTSPGGATDPPFLRDRQQSLAASNVFTERQTHALFPFASSRLRVRPSGLNSRSMAAKITESRKRTLFPSDETALLEHSP